MKSDDQTILSGKGINSFIIIGSILISGLVMYLLPDITDLFSPIFFVIIVLCALNFSRSAVLTIVFIIACLTLGRIIIEGEEYRLISWGFSSLGMLIIGILVNHYVESMKKVQRFHDERNAILEVSSTLTKNLNMGCLTEQILEHAFKMFSADGCTLYIISEDKKELIPLGAQEQNPDPEVLDQISTHRLKVGVGVVGWVAATGESVISGDAEMDYRSVHIPGTPYDLESLIAVPLMSEEETFGVLVIYKLRLNAFTQEDLELAKIIANQASIALANARLYEHVRNLSETDSLTGVWNSRRLNVIINKLIVDASEKGLSLSMLFIDCDDFKQINDRYGHPVGDLFLRFFAQVLHEGIREHDLIIRYAGDEFVILLPDTSSEEAIAVAERLKSLIGQCRMKDYPQLYTTVSMGLATYPAHAHDGESLIRYADDALYKAKKRGKNQFALYEDGEDQYGEQ